MTTATTTAADVLEAKLESPTRPGSRGAGDALPPVDEKKLVAKLDRHLIPLLMLLYTFSFLDRCVHYN